jgi:hypothetical protein
MLLQFFSLAGVHFNRFRGETLLRGLSCNLAGKPFGCAGLTSVQHQQRLQRAARLDLIDGLFLFASKQAREETV